MDTCLVVAEQAANRSLRLEPHHEVDGLDSLGATVDEISEEEEAGVPAAPSLVRVEQAVAAKQRDERLTMSVDVADDEGRQR